MRLLLFVLALLFTKLAICQKSDTLINTRLLQELGENACKCADSISVNNKKKTDIVEELSKCIDDQTAAYQIGSKLMNIDTSKSNLGKKGAKREINLTINMNKESDEYKEYYYEMERYLMGNCKSVKTKLATNDVEGEKSLSSNKEALNLYLKGVEEAKKGNHEQEIIYYEQALKLDSEFVFAWDNLGITYRKLGKYDKAIEAYQKSLSIDPKGITPLQNIAIAYAYKKEYLKAIEAYQRLSEIDKNNPEVYYGIGNIYTNFLQDYENGLSNMCKAYNLYIEQKSPYRTDAEKMINVIFYQMKKLGKEGRFNEILKENHIARNKI